MTDNINWIEHDGSDKCPVPPGVRWGLKTRDGYVTTEPDLTPPEYRWEHRDHWADITHFWYEGCEADKPKNSWEGRLQKLTRGGYEWEIFAERSGFYWGRVWHHSIWLPASWDVATLACPGDPTYDLLPIEPPKPVEVVRYHVFDAHDAAGFDTLEAARMWRHVYNCHPSYIEKRTYRNGKLVSVELVNKEDSK